MNFSGKECHLSVTGTFYREGEGGREGGEEEGGRGGEKKGREGGREGKRKRKHIFVKYKIYNIALSGSLYLA